jgi:hypothetical protein
VRLVKGSELTPDQRSQVLNAFVYRHTIQHPSPQSYAKGRAPTPTQTDDDWLREHAFHFTKNGRLAMNRHYAEPAFMVDPDSVPVSKRRHLV